MISPELLLSRRFITNVLKNPEFRSKVISIFVDEAHVISHWGSGFRKKYGELGIIRSFIPKSTSIVAVSATLPPRVRRDVIRVLRYHPQQYVSIDVGNDRPNVTIVVRGIQHPLNSYADLDFIVEDLANDRNQIPKTFIYCDNIAMGTEIIDHLMTLLPENLRHDGIIRPYNACFSKDYRKAVRIKFKSGEVRILVCTDAAGMVSYSIFELTSKLMFHRVATYQMWTSLYSGSSQSQCQHLFKELDVLQEHPVGKEWLYSSQNHQHTPPF